MGLWDDDFFSTKPVRSTLRGERFWGGYKTRGYRRRNHKALPPAFVFAAVLIVAAALIILLFKAIFGGASGASTEDRVVNAVHAVNSAVVSVVAQTNGDEEGLPAAGKSIGSGVIFEKSGGHAFVVTNAHVVENAKDTEVILINGEHTPAKIVGNDRISDLAVLEIGAKGVGKAAGFGNSAKLQAGQTAIAIGNPLGLAFSQTITVGVISSPSRVIPVSLDNDGTPDWEMEVIQTDAAINFGNSGGALIDLNGRVIGINTGKIAEFGVEGMGFAIPSNQVEPIARKLMRNGSLQRPFLGIYHQDLQAIRAGAETLKLPAKVKTGVVVLEATGPAKLAGMRTNDVIVAFDKTPINNSIELRKYLYEKKSVGDKLTVSFYRDGKLQKITVKLAEMKDE
ncbi:MAG TPA: trypsin-like peptidase domain-containing protein [Bacilli bacterium]